MLYLDKVKRRIFEEAGLKFSGFDDDNEMEFIGTDKQWDLATANMSDFINHDCHTSPESSCAVCEKYVDCR